MANLSYPLLYQINTRVWLTELSRALGKRATLDDIPDAELDRLAALGFDWIWFLSVWQTGPVGRAISRANLEGRRGFAGTLPDLKDEDIGGPAFSPPQKTLPPGLRRGCGGPAGGGKGGQGPPRQGAGKREGPASLRTSSVSCWPWQN